MGPGETREGSRAPRGGGGAERHLQPRPRRAAAVRGERSAATATATSPAPLPPPAAICTPSAARPAPHAQPRRAAGRYLLISMLWNKDLLQLHVQDTLG